MSPETWAGLAAIAGAFGGGLAKHAWTARKARNGNGDGRRNGDSTIQLKLHEQARLAKMEHELMDADGYVRKSFHTHANELQVVMGRVALQGQAIDTLTETVDRVEGKVDAVGQQITDLRVDLARRG